MPCTFSDDIAFTFSNVFRARVQGQRPPDDKDNLFLYGRRPPPDGFGSMHSILETKAFFPRNGTAMSPSTLLSGSASRARIRYYMAYGESLFKLKTSEFFFMFAHTRNRMLAMFWQGGALGMLT